MCRRSIDSIVSADHRIRRCVASVLGEAVEFNEILSVMYREGQKMSWHDDGEHGESHAARPSCRVLFNDAGPFTHSRLGPRCRGSLPWLASDHVVPAKVRVQRHAAAPTCAQPDLVPWRCGHHGGPCDSVPFRPPRHPCRPSRRGDGTRHPWRFPRVGRISWRKASPIQAHAWRRERGGGSVEKRRDRRHETCDVCWPLVGGNVACRRVRTGRCGRLRHVGGRVSAGVGGNAAGGPLGLGPEV